MKGQKRMVRPRLRAGKAGWGEMKKPEELPLFRP